jgi:HEAT repeat protein
MKNKICNNASSRLFSLIAVAAIVFCKGIVEGQQANSLTNQPVEEAVIALIDLHSHAHAPDVDFRKSIIGFTEHRQQVVQSLLKIFNNSTYSPSSTPKCYSAYFLGIMRAEGAADSLAAQIGIQAQAHGMSDPLCGYEPAANALIAIGNPAIPAVIRNLAESGDAQVREISLRVLKRIDDDLDITQLRLEKALKKETDGAKQARLQAALKALADLK